MPILCGRTMTLADVTAVYHPVFALHGVYLQPVQVQHRAAFKDYPSTSASEISGSQFTASEGWLAHPARHSRL